MRRRLVAALALAAACKGDPVPVSDGLDPLEANTAPWPEGDHPETLSVVTGSAEDWDWGHGRGWVRAPVADVLAAMEEPEVALDRREVDAWSVTWDTRPEYPASFTLHNEVDDIVTVTFDVTWRFGWTAEDGSEAGARWEKTDGSSVIELLEGSVRVFAEEDAIAGVEVVEHLDSIQADDTPHVESFLRDWFGDLVARAHGEPLPELDAR